MMERGREANGKVAPIIYIANGLLPNGPHDGRQWQRNDDGEDEVTAICSRKKEYFKLIITSRGFRSASSLQIQLGRIYLKLFYGAR